MDEVNIHLEVQSPTERLLRRRSVRLGLIWGGWTIVGLFFTSQAIVQTMSMVERYPYGSLFFWQMSVCYLWALSTPLVLWLARRFRIDREKWPTRILLHLLLSVAFGGAISAIHYPLFMTQMGEAAKMTAFGDFRNVLINLDRQIFIYWLLVLLSHALNYYKSFREGELKTSQLHTQLVQSQLEALKMQVHPHFLFNTLHSISALLHSDPEAARRMITRLGDFLRLTLENAGTQEVTLEQEMQFLNVYLEIERVRFQDRLTTIVEVDPAVLDARVPNLILQPIVENAMRHAVATSSHAGRIEITAVPRNGVVRIQVKDNGPGLSAQPSLARAGKGLGLANTQARLERLYGSNQSMDLNNDPVGGGLIVTLEIPRHT